jgi:hypothetical protein
MGRRGLVKPVPETSARHRSQYSFAGRRLLAAVYGNGTGLDMGNDAGTGSLEGVGAGYDPVGRTTDVEEFINGKWKKSGPIYPTDVPPN